MKLFYFRLVLLRDNISIQLRNLYLSVSSKLSIVQKIISAVMVAGHGNHSYTLKTMEDLIPMNVIHTMEKLVFILNSIFFFAL